MKQVYYFFISLVLTAILTSCDTNNTSSDNTGEVLRVDLGEGIFNDPFPYNGYRPDYMVKLLHYPPLSWFWFNSDTIVKTRQLEIGFNDDAIRSSSKINFYTVFPTDTSIENMVDVWINNQKVTRTTPFTLVAKNKNETIHLKIKISPEIGDTIIQGMILAESNDLDETNGVSFSQGQCPVIEYKATQKIGWPLLLWLLLILLIALVVWLVIKLLIPVVVSLSKISLSLSSVALPSFSFNRNRYNNTSSFNKSRKNNMSNKKDNKRHDDSRKLTWPEVAISIGLDWVDYSFYKKKFIAEKVKDLKKIIHYHEHLNIDMKDTVWKVYPQEVKDLIERFFGKNWKCPKSHGHWLGERGNSVFIPDSNFKPSNGDRSNPNNLCWKDILKRYDIIGIEFKEYEANFFPIAYDKVTIHNCNDSDFTRYKEGDAECGLHDRANILIAKKWQREGKIKIKDNGNEDNAIIEAARKKIDDRNLCWHECQDCCTLLLVPREVHHNIPHLGGIAMAKIVHG